MRDNTRIYLRTVAAMLYSPVTYLFILLFAAVIFLMYAGGVVITEKIYSIDTSSIENKIASSVIIILLVLLLVVVSFAIKTVLLDHFKDVISEIKLDVKRSRFKELQNYFNNFIELFVMVNDDKYRFDRDPIYVSEEIYYNLCFRNITYNFVLDKNRRGKSMGLQMKGELIDEVKEFFEYDKGQ